MPSSYDSLSQKFAVGSETGFFPGEGYVNITVFGKNGETVTKSITKDEARELAIKILQAAR